MATINNSASATYGYGRDSQDSAVSNVVTANLLEEFSLSGSKNVQNPSFRPGEILSYYITATNTGTDSLYNLTFVDDLGADSLDIFQIIMGLEEEFDIEIANEEAENIVTVADAVEQIKKALN